MLYVHRDHKSVHLFINTAPKLWFVLVFKLLLYVHRSEMAY